MLRLLYAAALCCLFMPAHAQEPKPVQAKAKKKHSFYLSWGYNGEWYTRSKVYVKQDNPGSDYVLHNVQAHDHKGWNDGDFFKQQLSIPQYNYRLGYVIDEQRGIGIEINFDHTKYIIRDEQDMRLTGMLAGEKVDTTIHFSEANGFYYFLNNGANFFLINLMKRKTLCESVNKNIRVDVLGKVGIGPVVPHVQNSFFGKANDPHFQIGGWNAGLEGDLKVTFFRHVYLEYGAKLDYARYSHLKIYQGTVHQAFGTAEMILSLGLYL